MAFPYDSAELAAAKNRRRVALVVQVSRDCRPIAAALVGDIDYLTGRKLSWLYRERAAEIVDEVPIRAMFEGDGIRVSVCIRLDFDKYVGEQGEGFRIISAELIPGALNRFAVLMRHFPIWTLHDPAERARHDRVLVDADPSAALERFMDLIRDPAPTYPRITRLIDVWDPPQECIDTYRAESDGLVDLLTKHLRMEGPSSIYRDCALHLCGHAGTLCSNDGDLIGLVDMAEELVRRFWPTGERHRLAARRDEALKAVGAAGDHITSLRTAEDWMNPRQRELVLAKEACRFEYREALLPIMFEIGADMIECRIPLHGERLETTLLGAAWLGDDDHDDNPVRRPLALLPGTS
jgi:hypothetical protein